MNDNYFRPRRFTILPEIIKTLIAINLTFFVATIVINNVFGVSMEEYLGLYLPISDNFSPIQVVTHIFMHSRYNYMHILINMFMLWMFGSRLENMWGGKRFLVFYLITGFGGALLHWFASYIEFSWVASELSPNLLAMIKNEGNDILMSGRNFTNTAAAKANLLLNRPTIGASGAVYGVMMAFAMMFPYERIYLYFLFPIQIRYFVMAIIVIELLSGVSANGGTIAHFAHLGGMLFGYILIKYWRKKNEVY